MKKMLMAATAACVVAFTGCKTVPTAETVNNISYTMGASTALVIKMMNLDQETVSSINMVLASVKEYVPAADATFEETWGPVAEKLIFQLVEDGKIKEKYAKTVLKAVDAIAKGIDRLFEKNPTWKQYEDLTRVGIDGFLNGYAVVTKFKTSAAAENADMRETELICERSGITFNPDIK